MKIHNIEQGTDEWFTLKSGKMSASHAQAISANGKGLETYILEMMAEHYSSAEKENYTNEHMERGNELEYTARGLYELRTGSTVEQVGFVELDEFTGCSPDGLVGEDGLLEIKCPSDKVYFKLLLDGKVDAKYEWQMQMQMLVTGRKWCDYLAFCPNYNPGMKIIRVDRDEAKIEKLRIGLEVGKQIIQDIKQKAESFNNQSNE